jgi:hypothetical protein
VTAAASAVPSVTGFGPLVRVARGGFASVYRAEDEHIGRVVAIKVLERLDAGDPRSRDRFLRETRAMGRLSGLAHIVDIYQATFTTDGQPCIVMPFFTGGSLEDRLTVAGPLTVDSAVAVGVTIGRAVDTAHRRGISHRDLKPGNILVDEGGDVALADFGIAVVEDAAASSQTRSALSPEHAAPERLLVPADGPAPEPWGDQFSLASTMHMLLTGRPPFGLVAELGLHEVLRRIVEAPAPATGRPDVPAALEEVLARALAKRPEARYPSAAAFTDALLAVGVGLADPPVPAGPIVGETATATAAAALPGVRRPADDWRSARTASGGGGRVTPRSPGPVPYHDVSPGPAPTPAPVAPHWSTPRLAPTPPPVLSPGMHATPPVPPAPPGAAPAMPPARPPAPVPTMTPPGPTFTPPGPTMTPPGPTFATPGPAPVPTMTPPGPTFTPPGPAPTPPPSPAMADAGPHVHSQRDGTAEPVPGYRHHRPAGETVPGLPPTGEASSRTRRALLVGSAAWIVVAAIVVVGIVLRNQPPPSSIAGPSTIDDAVSEPDSGPDPAPGPQPTGPQPTGPGLSVPVGTTVPAGDGQSRPRIDSFKPVPGIGLMVWWTDDAASGPHGYAYQLSVDDQPVKPVTTGARPDGTPRLSQEITTVNRNGIQERIDVAAHTYCVVIRRLGTAGVVDSQPTCLTRGSTDAPAP